MNLEDMSTKDLERLYHKHFGRIKSGITPERGEQMKQERAKEPKKRQGVPGSESPETNKLDRDVQRSVRLGDTVRIPHKYVTRHPQGDHIVVEELNPGDFPGSIGGRPVAAPEDYMLPHRDMIRSIHSGTKDPSPQDPHEFQEIVPEPESKSYENLSYLNSLSTKDLRMLHLKSLRVKHKAVDPQKMQKIVRATEASLKHDDERNYSSSNRMHQSMNDEEKQEWESYLHSIRIGGQGEVF